MFLVLQYKIQRYNHTPLLCHESLTTAQHVSQTFDLIFNSPQNPRATIRISEKKQQKTTYIYLPEKAVKSVPISRYNHST